MAFGGRQYVKIARDPSDFTKLTEYECVMLERNAYYNGIQFLGGNFGGATRFPYDFASDIYIPKWGGWKLSDIFVDNIVEVIEEIFSDFIDSYDTSYPSSGQAWFSGFDLNKPFGGTNRNNSCIPAVQWEAGGTSARALGFSFRCTYQQVTNPTSTGAITNFVRCPIFPWVSSPYGAVSKAQAAAYLDGYLKDIKADRIRYFPCQIDYYRHNGEPSYTERLDTQGLNTYNTPYMIAIYKNASSLFGASGWGTTYSTAIVCELRTDTSDEPDPTDPYETPDPQDDNPSSTDPYIGGDGDWTLPDDPVPEPTLPTVDMTGAGVATIYNPSAGQLRSFSKYFWDPTILAVVRQMISSVDEVFIRLHIIPVKPSTEGSTNIIAGWLDSGVSAPVVAYDTVTFDFGTIEISHYFGSYMDYNPYTKFHLYLPYIGMVDLNADDYMPKTANGKTRIGVKYHISVSSGACTAFVLKDSNVYAQFTGNCATEIPFTAGSAAQLWTGLLSAVSTLAIAEGASSALTPNSEITKIEADALAAKIGDSQLPLPDQESLQLSNKAHQLRAENQDTIRTSSERHNVLRTAQEVVSSKYHVSKMGQIGANAGQIGLRKAVLYATRPNQIHPENYKAYEGYPLNQTRKLSECHGYTKFEKVILQGLTATQSELREIDALLKQGVYL